MQSYSPMSSIFGPFRWHRIVFGSSLLFLQILWIDSHFSALQVFFFSPPLHSSYESSHFSLCPYVLIFPNHFPLMLQQEHSSCRSEFLFYPTLFWRIFAICCPWVPLLNLPPFCPSAVAPFIRIWVVSSSYCLLFFFFFCPFYNSLRESVTGFLSFKKWPLFLPYERFLMNNVIFEFSFPLLPPPHTPFSCPDP